MQLASISFTPALLQTKHLYKTTRESNLKPRVMFASRQGRSAATPSGQSELKRPSRMDYFKTQFQEIRTQIEGVETEEEARLLITSFKDIAAEITEHPSLIAQSAQEIISLLDVKANASNKKKAAEKAAAFYICALNLASISEQYVKQDPNLLCQIVREKAITLSSFGKPQEAKELVEKSLEQYKDQIEPGLKVFLIKTLIHINAKLKLYTDNLPLADECLQNAELLDNESLAKMYRAKAGALVRMGRRGEGLEVLGQAIKLLGEASPNNYMDLSDMYKELYSYTYRGQGGPAEAAQQARKAVDALKGNFPERLPRHLRNFVIATRVSNKGKTKEHERTIGVIEDLIKEFESHNGKMNPAEAELLYQKCFSLRLIKAKSSERYPLIKQVIEFYEQSEKPDYEFLKDAYIEMIYTPAYSYEDGYSKEKLLQDASVHLRNYGGLLQEVRSKVSGQREKQRARRKDFLDEDGKPLPPKLKKQQPNPNTTNNS